MLNLREFGTAKYPIRASNIRKIVTCNMESVLELIGELTDSAGAGAETGTITHAAVEAFHREQGNVEAKTMAGLVALRDATKRNPLGDEKEASIYFAHYANDPRNQNAEFIKPAGSDGLEYQMYGSLPAHETDPTGEPIVINGKVDQLRMFHGKRCVMDYKTGKTSAYEMQAVYAYQMAAYLYLANQNGFNMDEVYIIRGYRYRERGADLPSPAEAFVAMPFVAGQELLILDRLRLEVARIRSGELQFGPSAMCSWCPAKSMSRCIPLARTKLGVK